MSNSPSDGATYVPKLEDQAAQREALVKKRLAVRGAYQEIKDTPALTDLMEFINSQSQGCRDKAVTTDNKVIEDRHLHMMLMSDIIKQYIENQLKV